MRVQQSLRLVVAVLLVAVATPLEEVKFADMDPKGENQVVLVYKSGEEASDGALAAVMDARDKLKGMGLAGLESLQFRKSDAADAGNAYEMLNKGIATYPMLFMAVEGQGLDRYMREIEADKIADYIRTKLEPSTDDDVFPFNRELITKDYPTMVHFTEPWCTRCKTFRHAFQHVATATVGAVMCMEVECSATKDSKKFCEQHKVDGYPTVMLVGGDLKKPVEFTKDRSIPVSSPGVKRVTDFHRKTDPEICTILLKNGTTARFALITRAMGQALFEFLKETVPDAMLALDDEVVA